SVPATLSASTSDFGLATASAPQQASIRKYDKKNDWARHRQQITELYSKKPLKEVVAIMEQEHNFVATKRMYKTRFREWGIRKNVTVGQVLECADTSLGAQQESDRQVNQQLCTQNLNPLPHSDGMDTSNGPDLDRVKRYVRRKPTGLMKLPPKDRERAEAQFGSPKI
ncbi:Clr5 domain-containing protein, partial [Diaporthe sp. PMI_573]